MRNFDLHYKDEYIAYIFVLISGLFYCYFSLPEEKQPTFLFYAGSLLLSMLFIYLSEMTEKRGYSIMLFLAGMTILGCAMAFKLPDAFDDDAYMKIFSRAKNPNMFAYLMATSHEKGYLLFNWLIYRITAGNYNYFKAIITFISFFIWGWAFRKVGYMKGSQMFMALFLWSHFYFFVMNAGLIRIFMAIPIVFIAITYIWKNQWKKYFLWIIMASLFHLSSLVMLLLLLFKLNQKFYYDHWIFFTFLSFIVVVIGLVTMANFLVPLLGERYEGYQNVSDISFNLGSFTTFPIWIACYYYYKNLPKVSLEYRRKYIIGMLLLSLSIVFSVAVTIVHVGRIIYYSYLGLLIVISAIFQIRTRDFTDFILKCLLIVYSLVYVMSTTLTNDYCSKLFPYESFLNSEQDINSNE